MFAPLFLAGLLAQASNGVAGLAWTELFVFLVPAAIAAAGSNLSPARFLRLSPPARPAAVALGLAIGLGGYVLASAVMGLAQLFYPARWVRAFDVARLFEGPAWQAIALAALASFLAPVCEESAFRGWVQTTVGLRRGPVPAIVASTLAFSVLHLDPVRLPALLVLGATFGWLAWRSGSVWPSIAAHVANNGVASILALTLGARAGAAAEKPAAAAVLLQIAVGAAILGALLVAYRRVTPAPPPFQAAAVPLDPAVPVARFSAARVPPRWVAVALLGAAAFGAIVLAASLHAAAAAL